MKKHMDISLADIQQLRTTAEMLVRNISRLEEGLKRGKPHPPELLVAIRMFAIRQLLENPYGQRTLH